MPHRLHRGYVFLDCPAQLAERPDSGPTRSEAVAVVSCGRTASHPGARLDRCVAGGGRRCAGIASSAVSASFQYALAPLCPPHLPQKLTSFNTSIFPCTGLTSAYPWHYPRHLLLEPSCLSVAYGWRLLSRALDVLGTMPESHRQVTPFRVPICS